jgi:hypothetical protein
MKLSFEVTHLTHLEIAPASVNVPSFRRYVWVKNRLILRTISNLPRHLTPCADYSTLLKPNVGRSFTDLRLKSYRAYPKSNYIKIIGINPQKVSLALLVLIPKVHFNIMVLHRYLQLTHILIQSQFSLISFIQANRFIHLKPRSLPSSNSGKLPLFSAVSRLHLL